MSRNLNGFLACILATTSLSAQDLATVGPEKGNLVIMGGGGKEMANIFGRFVDLAGG